MTTPDYAAGTKQLVSFFRRKGISAATAEDLAQDTWLRVAEAKRRGAVTYIGTGAAVRNAHWVLLDHWRQEEKREETVVATFAEDARPVQLRPECEGKKKTKRRARRRRRHP